MVIGVAEENGRPVLPPVGLLPEQIDAIQKELLNLGNSAIQPSYHPLTATYDIQGKTILVLWAFGGEIRPYKAKVSLSNKKSDWAYSVRKHTSTVKAIFETDEGRSYFLVRLPVHEKVAELEQAIPEVTVEVAAEVKGELVALLNVIKGRMTRHAAAYKSTV